MRIALVARRFNESGGAERYAVDLARELAAQGHEMHLFGVNFDELPFATKLYPIRLPFDKPGWLRMLYFRRAAANALARYRLAYDVSYSITQVYPADAVFLGGGMNRFWLQTRFKSKLWQRLYPLINHNQFAQNYLDTKICQARQCKKLIANSHLVKRHAIEYGGALPGLIEVVHNGLDDSRFNPETREKFRAETRNALAIPEEQLAIAYVSQNWERKGLASIIVALGMLSVADRERFCLLVVGRGKPEAYRKIAQKADVLNRNLRFIGFTSAPEKIYAASDLSILPTQYDPCASVTIEAMACGLPAISTAQNGASELIRESETGFILSAHNDTEKLADCLRALLDDTRRGQMARAAAETMRDQTFARAARQTAAILQNL